MAGGRTMSCRVSRCARPVVWFGFCSSCFRKLPLESLQEFDRCFNDSDMGRALADAQRYLESRRVEPNCSEPVPTCTSPWCGTGLKRCAS